MKAERIVLDTNCLLQTLPKMSPYHRVLTDIFAGRISLCVSNEILFEYEEIIARESGKTIARNVTDAIAFNPYTLRIEPFYKFNFIQKDPSDNKFVDCAIAARARYIVTNDSHFNVLRQIEFPRVNITRLDDYLKELEACSEE